jgi:hypothetical protein
MNSNAQNALIVSGKSQKQKQWAIFSDPPPRAASMLGAVASRAKFQLGEARPSQKSAEDSNWQRGVACEFQKVRKVRIGNVTSRYL